MDLEELVQIAEHHAERAMMAAAETEAIRDMVLAREAEKSMSLTEKVKRYFRRGKHRAEKPAVRVEETTPIAARIEVNAWRRAMTQSKREAAMKEREKTHKMAPANKTFANNDW